MVSPDIIEAASVAHDEAILRCLSLILDAQSRPLHPNPAADDDGNGMLTTRGTPPAQSGTLFYL